MDKKKDGSPNKMWKQRPYGQIGKCAEAAALRRAFPEEIGMIILPKKINNNSIT